MNPSNRIIQALWIGPSLSIMEQLCIRSFLANGHEFHLYVYEDVGNVPAGTICQDANAIVESKHIFVLKDGFAKGTVSAFSELFRWELLKQKGGWWVDMDVVCLKPFSIEQETVICSSFEAQWGNLANTCIIKFPAHCPLAVFLSDTAWSVDKDKVRFIEIGPLLLQRAVAEMKLNKYVVKPEIFCPITWRSVDRIVYPPSRVTLKSILKNTKRMLRELFKPQTRPGKITSETLGVHLWNEMWKNSGFDKNEEYDKKCLYERLKKRYL